jgi:hypothetical protein
MVNYSFLNNNFNQLYYNILWTFSCTFGLVSVWTITFIFPNGKTGGNNSGNLFRIKILASQW